MSDFVTEYKVVFFDFLVETNADLMTLGDCREKDITPFTHDIYVYSGGRMTFIPSQIYLDGENAINVAVKNKEYKHND